MVKKREMTVLDVLVQVRDLLKVKKRWAQCGMAFDTQNKPVLSKSLDAVRWCILGAIQKESPTLRLYDKVTRIFNNISEKGIEEVNDAYGHKPIMRLIDIAIKNEREGRNMQ